MYQMQAEILASVPQHVGYPTKNTTPSQPWTGYKTDGLGAEFPTIRFSGGYFLIWPLYVAGSMRISTPEVREFCVKNLRYIGTYMGIEHANLLASIMQQKIPITVWHEQKLHFSKTTMDEDLTHHNKCTTSGVE